MPKDSVLRKQLLPLPGKDPPVLTPLEWGTSGPFLLRIRREMDGRVRHALGSVGSEGLDAMLPPRETTSTVRRPIPNDWCRKGQTSSEVRADVYRSYRVVTLDSPADGHRRCGYGVVWLSHRLAKPITRVQIPVPALRFFGTVRESPRPGASVVTALRGGTFPRRGPVPRRPSTPTGANREYPGEPAG